MSLIITPETGMPVLYHPHGDDHIASFGSKPLAAQISHVWDERQVNVAILDSNGLVYNRTSVLLWQPKADCEMVPTGGRWCLFPDWFRRVMSAGLAPQMAPQRPLPVPSIGPLAPALQPMWVGQGPNWVGP